MSWFNDVCSSVGNAISNVAEKVGDAADAIYVTSEEAAEGENGIFGAGGVITDCLTITEAEANGTEEGSWVHGGIFKESGVIGGAIHTISNGINTVATAVNDYVLKPVGATISKGWEAIKENPVLGVVALGAAIGVGIALWPVTTTLTGAAALSMGAVSTTAATAAMVTTTGTVGGALLGGLGTALGLTALFGLGSGGDSNEAVSGDGILTNADLLGSIDGLTEEDAVSLISLLQANGYIDENGNVGKLPENILEIATLDTPNIRLSKYAEGVYNVLIAQGMAV